MSAQPDEPETVEIPPPGDGEPEPEPTPEPEPEPEPTPEPEPEPEPTPEPTGPQSDKAIERAMVKLDAEATRHANRVGEIMGEDANDLVPCPLCWPQAPGFRFPVAPEPEQAAAVLAALGMDPEPDYDRAEDARGCEKCHGLGKVLTGSQVPEHRTKLCASCGGAGWIPVTAEGAGTPPAPLVVVPPPPPSQGAVELPETDPWGRPKGDPKYGLMPGYGG